MKDLAINPKVKGPEYYDFVRYEADNLPKESIKNGRDLFLRVNPPLKMITPPNLPLF